MEGFDASIFKREGSKIDLEINATINTSPTLSPDLISPTFAPQPTVSDSNTTDSATVSTTTTTITTTTLTDSKEDEELTDRKQYAATTGGYTSPLARFYLAGRIYHLLPKQDPELVGVSRKCCCGGLPIRKRSVVYISAQETFSRGVVIGNTMFTDHMPSNYTLQDVTFPEEDSE